jgi:cytochrome c oxidase subunit 1
MSVDVHLHDTYFVVGHFHYVMMGGAVTAFFAGMHYWWPKIFGRMYNETWGRIGCVLVFIGVNGTFFPQLVMGSRGMPRRYWHYLEEFQLWHVLSSIGAFILGFGFLVTAIYLIASFFKKMDAPRNPWGSAALEWKTTSPPPYYNFHTPPAVADHPYHYDNLIYDPALKGYREIDPHAEEHAVAPAGS